MKKFAAIMLSVLLLTLAGCAKNNTPPEKVYAADDISFTVPSGWTVKEENGDLRFAEGSHEVGGLTRRPLPEMGLTMDQTEDNSVEWVQALGISLTADYMTSSSLYSDLNLWCGTVDGHNYSHELFVKNDSVLDFWYDQDTLTPAAQEQLLSSIQTTKA